MTRSARNRLATALAGIAIAAAAVAWAMGEVPEKTQMAPRDKHEVARMIQKMKTVCIGRFLVDLPQETELELSNPSIDGFHFSTFKESAEEFQRRVATREAQIKAKPDRLGGDRNLESATEIRIENGVVGKSFVHGRQVTEGTAANGMELRRYRFENVAVEAMVHAGELASILAPGNMIPTWSAVFRNWLHRSFLILATRSLQSRAFVWTGLIFAIRSPPSNVSES